MGEPEYLTILLLMATVIVLSVVETAILLGAW